jgi:hypothetical protein
MADVEAVVVAENGTVVEAGGVYLTFSGDHEQPYAAAKIISIGGGPGGASPYVRLTPDLAPVASLDLWVKLAFAHHTSPPEGWALMALTGKHRIIPISVDVFLARGPPKFPIRVGTQAVTAEELAACVEDWFRREPESGTAE